MITLRRLKKRVADWWTEKKRLRAQVLELTTEVRTLGRRVGDAETDALHYADEAKRARQYAQAIVTPDMQRDLRGMIVAGDPVYMVPSEGPIRDVMITTRADDEYREYRIGWIDLQMRIAVPDVTRMPAGAIVDRIWSVHREGLVSRVAKELNQ